MKVFKKWQNIFLFILLISTFIFLVCRYIGNIIILVNAFLKIDINYIFGVKLNRIYGYRYTATITFFITLFIVFFISKNIRTIQTVIGYTKRSVQKIVYNVKINLYKIRYLVEGVTERIVYSVRKNVSEVLNFLYGWHLPLLLGIILFSVINNYVILKQDTRPLVYDSASYFISSLAYYDLIKNFASSITLMPITFFSTPFFMLTSLPFYYFFGKNPDIGVMTNCLYIIILVFSVYGIGKHFYNKKVGVLATFITITMPGIIVLSRAYRPDFPLAAMTMLSAYMLLLSNHFKNKKYSVLFGITTGLALITRVNYILFLIVILGLYTVPKMKLYEMKQIKNIVIAGVIALFIAIPWYADADTLSLLRDIRTANPLNEISYENLGYYNLDMAKIIQPSWADDNFIIPVKFSVSVFYTLLFLFALAYFLINGKNKEYLLSAWIFIPYILLCILNQFSNVTQSIWRYTLPCLPLIAVFISHFLWDIKFKKYTRLIIMIFFISGGLLQYTIFSYPTGINIEGVNTEPYIGIDSGIYTARQGDWKINEIINTIQPLKNNTLPVILFFSTSPFTPTDMSAITLDYEARLRGKNFDLRDPISCVPGKESKECRWTYDPKKLVQEADYIMIINQELKKGRLKSDSALKMQVELINEFDKNSYNFELNKRFVLPDDSTLSIYKRIA